MAARSRGGSIWKPRYCISSNRSISLAAGVKGNGKEKSGEMSHKRGQWHTLLRAEKTLRSSTSVVVITLVVKQLLPRNLALVSGQEDTVELATLLRARYVVPMNNGDVDAGGLLTGVLFTQGTDESFKAMIMVALKGQT
ncbi:hypothetical protein EJB05_01050, partial [Eragrostis curvula]